MSASEDPLTRSVASPPHPRKNATRALALLVTVFVFGFLGGAGGAFLLVKRKIRAVLSDPLSSKSPMDRALAAMEGDVIRKVHLTAEEQEAIHPVFIQTAERFQDFRRRTVQELRSLLHHMARDVCAALSGEKAEHARRVLENRVSPLGVELAKPSREERPKPSP